MAGYNGWPMSNNAVEAYDSGEMLLSRWSKGAILDAIKAENLDLKCSLEKISALPLSILKERLLKYTSWHHTSKFYNCTDFYSLDTDYIEDLTDDDVDRLLANHKDSIARKRAKKKAEIKESEVIKVEKDVENLAEKKSGISCRQLWMYYPAN